MTGKDFVKFDSQSRILAAKGEWNLSNLDKIKKELKIIHFPESGKIEIDGHSIQKMDSAGALLLGHCIRRLEKKNLIIQLIHFSKPHEQLLHLVDKKFSGPKKLELLPPTHFLIRTGKGAIGQYEEARDYLTFMGKLTLESARVLINPVHMRGRELIGIMYKSGFQALPIVAILSFMIGVVIAHQTGLQFQKYGANVFVVDLLGFAILREFGPLITAIIVAGRTGSAFTAQLGIMQVNQEIDALKTMGVTPEELLIIPRMAALIITLPLLTIWADVFGIMGGMIVTKNILHISHQQFLARFQHEIPLKALIIGLGKAPVFAFIIASIGCFQGMRVERNADSVGRLTTRSVVLSIFFILVVDAAFSILLNKFKL